MSNNKILTVFFAFFRHVSIFVLCLPVLAMAAPVPNFDKQISMTAREQPLTVFMRELFGQIDVPVIIEAQIDGNVNGRFMGVSAKSVFDDIGRSFGLVVYYDGAVAHIYTANNISQRFISIPKYMNDQVIKNIYDLNLTDEKNQLRSAKGGGLVVRGTKRFIEQVEELVYAAKNNTESYQSPLSFKVFYLKYAWAQDVTMNFAGQSVVIPGVATTLRYLTDDNSASAHSIQQQSPVENSPGLKGKGLSRGRLGLDATSSTVQVMDVNHLARPGVKDVRIGVDPRLNAIIVRDSPDRMGRYKALIDSLDIEPQMLEIEATIIDINTSRLRELGINWRKIDGDNQLLLGSGGASDLALNPGQVITSSGLGGFASFVIGNNNQFLGRINALESQGAARIVSSPHVLTLSNVEAIFDTNSTFYVRVAGQEEVDLFDVSVGTSLRVTPHVFKDDGEAKIKLLVNIEDGQQESQAVDNIPVIRNSTINTQALIGAGQSVLIGGLVREATTEGEDKVPFLGDVPVIGNLFKSKVKRTERIERMFLISPRLAATSKQNKDRFTLFQQGVDEVSPNESSVPTSLGGALIGADQLINTMASAENWLESYGRND